MYFAPEEVIPATGDKYLKRLSMGALLGLGNPTPF